MYVRVSTTEQGEKYGKDSQISQMRKWLAANDELYTFNEKYIYIDDGFSGASEIHERAELPRLFEDAKKKEFDVVLVWKLDRFFRKTRYLLNAIEDLRDIDIDFIATSQQEVNTTTTFGKFMLGLLGIIAEMERDLIMERTAIGRVEAAKDKKWVGGMHSYGYDIDPDSQKIAINPETSKIVQKIFKWFVRDRKTTYEIQQRLNALQIPTQADRVADKLRKKKKLKKEIRKVNPANYWHDKTVGRLLRNEAYTGLYYYGKKTKKYDAVAKKMKEVLNPEEDWIPIPCPQIISKKIWKKAQSLLEQNKRTQKLGRHTYLLSGKVDCARCMSTYGGYMKPQIKTIDGVKTKIGELPQYRCRKANKSKSPTPCDNKEISGSILEGRVWQEVSQLLSDPKVFIKRIEEEEKKKVNVYELEQERAEKQQEFDALTAEWQRVKNLYQKGFDYQGEGELEVESKRITEDKIKLTDDLEAIASQLMDAEERRERLIAAKDIAKKYAKALAKLDFETKRLIIHDLVKRIVIDGSDVTLELMIPESEKSDSRHNISDLYGVTGRD